MKNLIVLISLLTIFGCTNISNLKLPTIEQYFVLEEDYMRTQYDRGLLGFTWVEGLRAGTYVLVGEDEYGYYFKGEGDSVILLSQERADKYLNERYITPFSERNGPQFATAGGEGGIWLPKNGVEKAAKLFFLIKNTTDGSIGGPVGIVFVNMTEDALNYVEYGDEKELLNNIKIQNGLPK